MQYVRVNLRRIEAYVTVFFGPTQPPTNRDQLCDCEAAGIRRGPVAALQLVRSFSSLYLAGLSPA